MNHFSVRKFSLSMAAAAIALGAGATAFAGGYYGNYYGGHGGGYYSAGYYSGGHHGGHGYSGRRHHRRGHGGGKAAAIALGVIGGAIILNEISEDRARQRAYDDRYDRRYRRYSRRARPAYADDRDYIPQRDYDDAPQDGNPGGDDLDARLEGRDDGGPAPIRLSYGRAYQACMSHARAALSNRGFILAGPARPETVEEAGRAWKMTANVTAQNQRGETWTRAMYCEADDNRVYLLELI